MHGLHTTTWIFDTADYKAIKVVDQYRDVDHALMGALRVLKGLSEDGSDSYTISILNDEVVVMGDFLNGICITSDVCPIGLFIPNADIEEPLQIFVDGDEHFQM